MAGTGSRGERWIDVQTLSTATDLSAAASNRKIVVQNGENWELAGNQPTGRLGVAVDATSGTLDAVVEGSVMVRAGEAITAGEELTSDADSTAASAVDGKAVLGRAEHTADDTELVSVKLTPASPLRKID